MDSIGVLDRDACRALDEGDRLAHLREAFELPDGIVYLDGNSLGPLSRTARARLERATTGEWGSGLISSWTEAGWMKRPQRVGDRLARLVGAEPGEVIVSDTTSLNLYKLLLAGLQARPGRSVVLTEEGTFPTDLYVSEALAPEVRRVTRDRLVESLDESVAVLLLTHVDYRTGRMHDMAALTEAAHAVGALTLWDLCHSVGAVPVDLRGCGADMAVGCTYKFLNGGPGSPAFLHVAARLQASLRSPVRGWFGHADPLSFSDTYEPAPGVARFLTGTTGILGLAALDGALDVWDGLDMAAVREKSVAMADLLIRLVDERCPGVEVASPRAAAERGSQVSLRHPDARNLIDAMARRGVIGDFRPPDLIRLGITPLHTRFVDLWDAIAVLADLLSPGRW
jgi:kynureninase